MALKPVVPVFLACLLAFLSTTPISIASANNAAEAEPSAATPRRSLARRALAAKKHTFNWILPYSTSSSAVTLAKGDTVVLKWTGSREPHDVRRFPNKATFTSCTFLAGGKPIRANVSATTTGSFTIKWPGARKTVYYGCSVEARNNVGGHCLGGQKIAVTGK